MAKIRMASSRIIRAWRDNQMQRGVPSRNSGLGDKIRRDDRQVIGAFRGLIVARELRSQTRDGRMAAKVRIMKLLQEMRGLADITHRRPAPRQPGLFLIQLR